VIVCYPEQRQCARPGKDRLPLKGHEKRFVRRRLSGGYRFDKGTFAGTHRSGRDAPIGPCIATADEVPEPNDVIVQFWNDGQLRHNYNNDDMENGSTKACLTVSAAKSAKPAASKSDRSFDASASAKVRATDSARPGMYRAIIALI
jgi:hypothetical protein